MIKILFRKIRSAYQLSWPQISWLLILFPISGFVRFAVLILPFKYIKKLLGTHHSNFQLSTLVCNDQLNTAIEIGQSIKVMAKYTPWKSNCLVQAILARLLLSLYNLPHVLYFGTCITSSKATPMKAHAWVSVGSKIIVGGRGHNRYTIVGTYISDLS